MKKVKIIYFSKTITAYYLQVSGCIDLNNLMKLHEYQRSTSLFDLRQMSLLFQPYILFFSQKTVGLFETKYPVKASGIVVVVFPFS